MLEVDGGSNKFENNCAKSRDREIEAFRMTHLYYEIKILYGGKNQGTQLTQNETIK